MQKPFFKILCIDESDPFEFQVLEDVNCGNLEEVYDFLVEKMPLHDDAKWLLLPGTSKA